MLRPPQAGLPYFRALPSSTFSERGCRTPARVLWKEICSNCFRARMFTKKRREAVRASEAGLEIAPLVDQAERNALPKCFLDQQGFRMTRSRRVSAARPRTLPCSSPCPCHAHLPVIVQCACQTEGVGREQHSEERRRWREQDRVIWIRMDDCRHILGRLAQAAQVSVCVYSVLVLAAADRRFPVAPPGREEGARMGQ